MAGDLVLVGELNPYGADPRYALYDEPVHSAGGRLRRKILGLPRRVYFTLDRYNLCVGRWSAPAARAKVGEILQAHPEAQIAMLGRKVATAFGCQEVPPYTRHGRLLAIPHPSGLCREWGKPDAVSRVRTLLAEACPDIPFGSLDQLCPETSRPHRLSWDEEYDAGDNSTPTYNCEDCGEFAPEGWAPPPAEEG